MNHLTFLGKNISELLVNVNQTTNIFAYNFWIDSINFSELFLFLIIIILLLFHDFEKRYF